MGGVTKIKTNKNAYDLVCIDEIHDNLLIPYADMDQKHVCVVIAEEHSETIHYPVGEPDWADVKQANTGRSELVELNDEEINRNLHDFQRIPKTKEGIVLLHGGKLFQHMIKFRNLLCSKDGRLEPSKYLNI